jgi:hypothetical protein
MENLYKYLLTLGIAKNMYIDTYSIECYATSETMLALLRGLNFNDDGLNYHAELIACCTWVLTRS